MKGNCLNLLSLFDDSWSNWNILSSNKFTADFPQWTYEAQDWNCTVFSIFEEKHNISRGSLCEIYGVIIGSSGLSMNEACCECGGKLSAKLTAFIIE